MSNTKLTVGQLSKIRYTKADGEVTERAIVPTTVPGNIKALDVTGLPEALQEKVALEYQEYQKYLTLHMITVFSFEDWLGHRGTFEYEPKWRTFKPESTDSI